MAARRSGGHVEQVLMANLDQVVAVQSLRRTGAPSGLCRPPAGGGRALRRQRRPGAQQGGPGPAVSSELTAEDPWNYYLELGYVVVGLGGLRAGIDGIARRADRPHLPADRRLGRGQEHPAERDPAGPASAGQRGDGQRPAWAGTPPPAPSCSPWRMGGFIADSPGHPGFRSLGYGSAGGAGLFPDFREPAPACHFRTCLHRDEPGCGVKEAVAARSPPGGTRPIWPCWRIWKSGRRGRLPRRSEGGPRRPVAGSDRVEPDGLFGPRAAACPGAGCRSADASGSCSAWSVAHQPGRVCPEDWEIWPSSHIFRGLPGP